MRVVSSFPFTKRVAQNNLLVNQVLMFRYFQNVDLREILDGNADHLEDAFSEVAESREYLLES